MSRNEPSSIQGSKPLAGSFLNPWNWVVLIYGAHVLGALIAAQAFQISLTKVAVPVGLMVLGFIVAVVFRWYDAGFRIGWWKWWIPVIIYASVVFFLSHRSYPEAHAVMDPKLFHPVEYVTLGILLSGAWHSVLQRTGIPGFTFCVQLSGTAYAFSDELHQAFIPGRTSTLSDVLIDSVSIALGWGIFLLVRHFAPAIVCPFLDSGIDQAPQAHDGNPGAHQETRVG